MTVVGYGPEAAARPHDATARRVRARRAWRFVGSVLAVVALAYAAFAVVNQLAHEEHALAFSYPASAVRRVAVDIDHGSVRVIGGAGGANGAAGVSLHLSDGLQATTHHERLHAGELSLTASCPGLSPSFCSTDYTIRVPRGVAVVVHTGHGDVTVEGVSGRLDLASDHGDVDGTDLRASSARAASDHGDVTLAFAAPPAHVDGRAGHGDVDVILPRTPTAYRVEASADQGSVHAPVRTDPTGARVISAHSDHGDVTVRPSAG